MRRIIAAVIFIMIALSAAPAPAEDFLLGVVPEPSDLTPSFRSEEPRAAEEGSYWTTPMSLENEEAIWKMLTSPITKVIATA